MSVSNVEVGKKVKEMRLHNNMSQQEFSERTHITQSALSRYENGVTPIPYEVIENISKEFKLPVSYLLGIKQESMEEDELLLVAFYRKVDNRLKGKVLDFVKTISEDFWKMIEDLSVIWMFWYWKIKKVQEKR